MKSLFTASILAATLLSPPVFASEQTDDNQYLYPLLQAELALGRNQPQVALQNYIAVAKETQDPKIAARATEIALTVAGYEEAVEPAIIWANNAKKDIEAQLTIILLFMKTQQPTRTTQYFENLLALNDPDIDKEFLGLYRQLGNDAAEKDFQTQLSSLRKKYPNNVALPLTIAEINLFQGNLETTFKESENALKLEPSITRAMLMHAQAMLTIKGKEPTIDYLKTSLKKYPKDYVLKQFLVEILLEQGMPTEAKQVLNDLAQAPDLPANTLLQLAKMAINVGWSTEAKQLLVKAAKFSEQADTAHYLLARLAEINHNFPEAIKWYQQVYTGPFYILSRTQASHLMALNQQYDEALKLLDNTEPQTLNDLKRIVLGKSSILDKTKQYQSAYQLISRFLEKYPDETDFLYARSLISDKLNHTKEAETDLKAILAIDPDHVDALNALGYIIADTSTRYDEAYGYLSQAIKLAPNNPAVMDSMGWLEIKRKNYDDAVKWLKQALELKPDPEIAAHLGEALWYARKKDQAQKIWDQAIQTYPDHEILRNTMKRLLPNN